MKYCLIIFSLLLSGGISFCATNMTQSSSNQGESAVAAPIKQGDTSPNNKQCSCQHPKTSDVVDSVFSGVVSIETTQIVDSRGRSKPFPKEGGGRDEKEGRDGKDKPQTPDDEDDVQNFPGVPGSPLDELFREFFKGFSQNDRPRRVQGLGSGFVISIVDEKTAYIVTNNHVINDAKKITVYFHHDKTKAEAKLYANDERTDLAVLMVDLSSIPAAKRSKIKALEWGDSDKARPGDDVIAIGNPFGLGNTVTRGIVSSKGRDLIIPGKGRVTDYVDDFIQHSAQINQGNSGGVLLDPSGKIIGINTAIFTPSGGNVGIGFAIPSSLAAATVNQLILHKRTKRGWLGVKIQQMEEDALMALKLPQGCTGVIVAGVTHGGPAEAAGLRVKDVILEYNSKVLNKDNRLSRLVGETEVGKQVDVKVWRNGQEYVAKVIVGEFEEAVKKGKIDDSTSKGKNGSSQEILGIFVAPITAEMRQKSSLAPDTKGIVVRSVNVESTAWGKLVPDDIIEAVTIGGKQYDLNTPDDFLEAIKVAKGNLDYNGRMILLNVVRKGEPYFVSLEIESSSSKEGNKKKSQESPF